MEAGAWVPALRQAHVALVGLSVALFTARGFGVLAGGRWPMHPLPRLGSMAVDSLLLGAGLGLWVLLDLHPLSQPWLGTKLLLLLVYIGLGHLALRRARHRATRAAALAAALATVSTMVGIALAHDPAGWWAMR